MENNVYFKRFLYSIIIIVISFLCSIFIASFAIYNKFSIQYNIKTNSIINEVVNRYPDITSEEVLSILKSNKSYDNILDEYGYELDTDSLLKDTSNLRTTYIVSMLVLASIFMVIIIIVLMKYKEKTDKNIDELIELVERINKKDYPLEVKSYSEDKLSILRSEIYKTTVMLKEAADNSISDKIKLKDSLSDISHQLKTPLTSILIMLDNIIDDEDMDVDTREKFISEIRHNIININFLVQSILKLSRLDACVIEFKKEKCDIDMIVEESIHHIEPLMDLENIVIKKNFQAKRKVLCDSKWQIEAITNIIKNAIEHSDEKGIIEINTSSNDLYVEVDIIDHGEGMNKKDIKHIFDRFYRSENAHKDSIGIGLSLSKSIIERDNGKISVSSTINKGSKFSIRYFN